MDPSVREMWSNWDQASRRELAEFRAETGPRVADPLLRDLVARLVDASPAFRAAWERHDVNGFPSPEYVIRHPAGDLVLERQRLTYSDPPGMHLVICTPAPGTDTAALLRDIA